MQPLPQHLAPIRFWITAVAVLVVLMVLIGGLTRLTESGLSIVEWKLIDGILPPMSDAAWQKEFAAYQHSPEFKQVNSGFSVGDFKRIFWLEYIHRVLGRVIGLALLVPFAYFAARRMLPAPLCKRMLLACVLVAAQGAVGWIMVASGLVDEPRVAPLKLALHLSLALILFLLLIWTRWQVTGVPRGTAPGRSALAIRALFALTFFQVVLGALVAGIDAGYSYNTWPLMDGDFIPADLYFKAPWWLNHLEHIRMVQFQHRMLAYMVVGLCMLLAFVQHQRADKRQRRALYAMGTVVKLQFLLGVATLLSVMHIALASAHQMGAVLLLGTLAWLAWLYPSNSVRKLAK